MSSFNSDALDRYITGNYGEDQFKDMPPEGKCAHGCGFDAGDDGYCDKCYADGCLIGPDGTCRYEIETEHDDEG